MEFKTKEILNSTGDIKREAKAQLKGQWNIVILLCVIPIAIGAFVNLNIPVGNEGFSVDLNVIASLVNQLLYIGIVYTLIDHIRNRKIIAPFKDVFQVFSGKYFLPVLFIFILTSIYTSLWSLLLVIPGIIKRYAYAQSYNVYKDMTQDGTNKNVTANQAITESRKIMDGHKMDLFILDLSFLGWWILSLFTLGILLIWVIPYYQMSRAVFYQDLPKVILQEEWIL